MRRKPLEISLYTVGAGAFGVFLRWMQDQLAFNDKGLVDKSAFNVILPLFFIAAALVFRAFLRREKKENIAVPGDFDAAFRHEGRLFVLGRRVIGAVMVIGALLLFSGSETDQLASQLRVLALLGALTGLSYPLLLAQAGKERRSPGLLCLLSFVPVLFFAVWLIYCYRANSINSVIWGYVLELATASMGMVAFFRVAGYAFGAPNGPRTRFDAMFTATLCISSLADERYLGMQVMLIAAAAMLMLDHWILMDNRVKGEVKAALKPDDGFEHLG